MQNQSVQVHELFALYVLQMDNGTVPRFGKTCIQEYMYNGCILTTYMNMFEQV